MANLHISFSAKNMHGFKAILIALTRWTIGIVHGVVSFFVTSNIFFYYSSDSIETDCKDAVNCSSCIVSVSLRSSLFIVGLDLYCLLMIQLLKDTFTMTKLSYSTTLIH